MLSLHTRLGFRTATHQGRTQALSLLTLPSCTRAAWRANHSKGTEGSWRQRGRRSSPCCSTASYAHLNSVQADLKLEYLDLVLLHYPSCWGDLCKPLPGAAAPPPVADPQAPRTFLESWKALQDLYRRNKTRAIGAMGCVWLLGRPAAAVCVAGEAQWVWIRVRRAVHAGVSNFGVQDLEKLYAAAQIKPQVLQVRAFRCFPCWRWQRPGTWQVAALRAVRFIHVAPSDAHARTAARVAASPVLPGRCTWTHLRRARSSRRTAASTGYRCAAGARLQALACHLAQRA